MKKLTKKEQKELLGWARRVLKSYLASKRVPEDKSKRKIFAQKAGAFVTLSCGGQLRGCIGELEAKRSLWEIVKKVAIEAATGDPRFPPVTIEELPQIKIEISVLSPLKSISSWKKIKLGKQGVLIEKDDHCGTFLPQVATETGWDLEALLRVLCTQKCGLSPDAYKDPKTKVYVYEAQVFREENK